QVIGGWTLGSIVTWQTRPPFFVAANRSTFNNFNIATNNSAQLVGITFEDFKKNVGVFRRPEGVYFINPAILDILTDPTTGKFISPQLKPAFLGFPAPGRSGNFPINALAGPHYLNTDLSLLKRFRAKERV